METKYQKSSGKHFSNLKKSQVMVNCFEPLFALEILKKIKKGKLYRL